MHPDFVRAFVDERIARLHAQARHSDLLRAARPWRRTDRRTRRERSAAPNAAHGDRVRAGD